MHLIGPCPHEDTACRATSFNVGHHDFPGKSLNHCKVVGVRWSLASDHSIRSLMSFSSFSYWTWHTADSQAYKDLRCSISLAEACIQSIYIIMIKMTVTLRMHDTDCMSLGTSGIYRVIEENGSAHEFAYQCNGLHSISNYRSDHALTSLRSSESSSMQLVLIYYCDMYFRIRPLATERWISGCQPCTTSNERWPWTYERCDSLSSVL